MPARCEPCPGNIVKRLSIIPVPASLSCRKNRRKNCRKCGWKTWKSGPGERVEELLEELLEERFAEPEKGHRAVGERCSIL
jgi:uncharacterized protein with PIN domain